MKKEILLFNTHLSTRPKKTYPAAAAAAAYLSIVLCIPVTDFKWPNSFSTSSWLQSNFQLWILSLEKDKKENFFSWDKNFNYALNFILGFVLYNFWNFMKKRSWIWQKMKKFLKMRSFEKNSQVTHSQNV